VIAHSIDALAWGLAVREAAAKHTWPTVLLRHPMCQASTQVRLHLGVGWNVWKGPLMLHFQSCRHAQCYAACVLLLHWHMQTIEYTTNQPSTHTGLAAGAGPQGRASSAGDTGW
jgi:hypothetical protein